MINYLKTWFIIDFISNLPFEDIYNSLLNTNLYVSNSYLKILRITRVLRILKAFKL